MVAWYRTVYYWSDGVEKFVSIIPVLKYSMYDMPCIDSILSTYGRLITFLFFNLLIQLSTIVAM